MSRTSTRTSVTATTPQRIQIQPGKPMDEEGNVKCTGHQRRSLKLTAGPKSKNPGRVFYTCPLPRDDPKKCKFFKWEDELQASNRKHDAAGTSRAAQLAAATNQTLGQSPQARFGKPPPAAMTPTTSRVAALTPQSKSRVPETVEDDGDDIDWEQVDTDDLEREAIASTPGSSQRTEMTMGRSEEATSFNDRLRAIDEGVGKRKREYESGNASTPKRLAGTPIAEVNPFRTLSPQIASPAHVALSPLMATLGQVSEDLQRRDRLIQAGERAKEGFRQRIKALEERNKELEAKVRELEGR